MIKKIILSVLIIFMIFNFSCAKEQVKSKSGREQLDIIDYFLTSFSDNDLEKSYSIFSTDIKAMLSYEDFSKIRKEVYDYCGEFQSYNISNIVEKGQYRSFIVDSFHEKGKVVYTITFKLEEYIIEGFFYKYGEIQSIENVPYVKENKFVEEKILVKSGDYNLKGLLSIPKQSKDSYPLVVLVQGSGAHSMNEVIGPNKIFKNIAQGLSSNGIAVLRYNKRSFQYGEDFKNKNYSIEELIVEDLINAVKLGVNDLRIDKNRIYVLGHSLGGYIAPYIESELAKIDINIAGIILAAGIIDNMADLVMYQQEFLVSLDGGVSEEEQKYLDEVENVLDNIKSGKMDDSFNYIWPKDVWDFFNNYSQIEYLTNIAKSVLIIQGKNDWQVPYQMTKDAEAKLNKKANIEFNYYENINHLLMYYDKNSTGNEYYIAGYVDEEIINRIVEFIK